MGKTPHAAAAGMFVAMMTLAGCQSPAPTLGNPGTMSSLNGNRSQQPWNNGAATGGVAGQTQGGMGGLTNGQVANNAGMNRPQTGQSFGNSQQGNFANNGQQPGGSSQPQNGFANNQQSNGFNTTSGSSGVQQAAYNPNVANGSVQQAGSWANNMQSSGFSNGSRNMARNFDTGQPASTGAGSSTTPAPVFPNSNASGDNATSYDPPPVAKPATTSSTRYNDLPFSSGRASNQ